MPSHALLRGQHHHASGIAILAAIIRCSLSDETYRALETRAARHNRSPDAEMRAILEEAVLPEARLRLGSALAEISRGNGLTNADVEALEPALGRGHGPPRT